MKIEEVKNYYLELKPNKEWIESINVDFFFEFAETVLAELEKKDKIIDNMASELYYKCYDDLRSIKEIKDYFEKKVSEENEN